MFNRCSVHTLEFSQKSVIDTFFLQYVTFAIHLYYVIFHELVNKIFKGSKRTFNTLHGTNSNMISFFAICEALILRKIPCYHNIYIYIYIYIYKSVG